MREVMLAVSLSKHKHREGLNMDLCLTNIIFGHTKELGASPPPTHQAFAFPREAMRMRQGTPLLWSTSTLPLASSLHGLYNSS